MPDFLENYFHLTIIASCIIYVFIVGMIHKVEMIFKLFMILNTFWLQTRCTRDQFNQLGCCIYIFSLIFLTSTIEQTWVNWPTGSKPVHRRVKTHKAQLSLHVHGTICCWEVKVASFIQDSIGTTCFDSPLASNRPTKY